MSKKEDIKWRNGVLILFLAAFILAVMLFAGWINVKGQQIYEADDFLFKSDIPRIVDKVIEKIIKECVITNNRITVYDTISKDNSRYTKEFLERWYGKGELKVKSKKVSIEKWLNAEPKALKRYLFYYEPDKDSPYPECGIRIRDDNTLYLEIMEEKK